MPSVMKGERIIMLTYHMDKYGFQTETNYGNLQISSDSDHGYRPYELMVSSIAACSGLTLQRILDRMRQDYTDIYITADVVRNPDQVNRLEKIHLSFTVIESNASKKELDRAIKLIVKNCSMIQSVQDSITITETIKTE